MPEIFKILPRKPKFIHLKLPINQRTGLQRVLLTTKEKKLKKNDKYF